MQHSTHHSILSGAAAVCVALAAAGTTTEALAQTPVQVQQPCGSLSNAYGPYDYRVDTGPRLKIVEDNHFTPRVEMLVGGITTSIGGDIDYTLRAFPNHHRALVSLMKLSARLAADPPPGARLTVECYFERALMFRGDDHIARMIYVGYLAGKGRKEQALRHLEYVVANAGDDGAAHYNAGLLFMDLGDPARAVAQAHRAQALGFPGTALRQRLEAAGKWVEPPTAAPAPAASGASQAAG